MIHLGLHTDNWTPLSVGFEAACEKVAATGLKHIEFCAIHGQNFIAALGHDPGFPCNLTRDPSAASWTSSACRSLRLTAGTR